MENELKLKAIRLGENQGYSHLRDIGPWVAQRPGARQETPTITRPDGSTVGGSILQEDDLPSAPRKIFSDLIEDIREYVRTKKVTVHLYNEWDQPLHSISPERNIGLYESQYTITNVDGSKVSLGSMPREDDRPLCPECGTKAGFEPAHWEPNYNTPEWRWVCVDCDYAVSSDTDNKFSPTGKLACREMRRTRAILIEVFSMLWKSRLMEKAHAYKLLGQLFPHQKGERVNFATMDVLQMQRAADYAKDIMRERGREDRAKWAHNEMKRLYSAITHEEGEPTYLGDGMYLFPNGRVGEV
jgi:hypothetical protein